MRYEHVALCGDSADAVPPSRHRPPQPYSPRRDETLDGSSCLGDLRQAGIGTLPEIQKAFVLLQCGLLVSRPLEQPCDLEHIPRLEYRHPFLVGAVGQQLAIDPNRAREIPSRRRHACESIARIQIVRQNRQVRIQGAVPHLFRGFAGRKSGCRLLEIASGQRDFPGQRVVPPVLGLDGRVEKAFLHR